MTNNNEPIEKMKKFGISEAEAKIYTALLKKGELSAMEIHELTHVPRTRVYEITQKMILRGMCIKKQMGNKTRYQAVEPERAFNNLIKEYESDLDAKKRLAHVLAKLFSPLHNQKMQNADITKYVEIIADLPSIHERYVGLVRNTKHELLGFVKPPWAHQETERKLSEQENIEFEILKKGGVVRTLYEFPCEDELKWMISHIEMCVQAGEEARVIEQLPIKMYVFDGKYVLMALNTEGSPTSTLTMLVIDHPGLAQAARMLFEHLWEKAHDYRTLKALSQKIKP